MLLPTASALRLSAIVFGSPARIVMRTMASVSTTTAAVKPRAVRVVRSLSSSPRTSLLTTARSLPGRWSGGRRPPRARLPPRRARVPARRWRRPASPTSSVVRPGTTSSVPSTRTSAPSRSRAAASSVALGERTRTPVAVMRLAIEPLLTSRPRWMTTTSSTVCSTSESTWLETSTVRPSAAAPRRKSRSQRMPCGSRPLAGSSRTRTSGSPSSVAARPRRWRIPVE